MRKVEQSYKNDTQGPNIKDIWIKLKIDFFHSPYWEPNKMQWFDLFYNIQCSTSQCRALDVSRNIFLILIYIKNHLANATSILYLRWVWVLRTIISFRPFSAWNAVFRDHWKITPLLYDHEAQNQLYHKLQVALFFSIWGCFQCRKTKQETKHEIFPIIYSLGLEAI